MIISEVDFIVNNVLESIKLGNEVKEVISIPITDLMSTKDTFELAYTQVINKYKKKVEDDKNKKLSAEESKDLSNDIKEQNKTKLLLKSVEDFFIK